MAELGLMCISDYERKALTILSKQNAEYYAGGADDEETLADNVRDFRRFRLRPRMLVDVSNVSLRTSILGERIEFPICIAPSGMHMLANSCGEIGSAKAAEALGTCMALSTGANCSMDEIAKSCPLLLKWFQLYICRDRELSRQLVKRAERAGFKALVVTVDRPQQGCRRSSIRNQFSMPPHLRYKNLEGLTTSPGGDNTDQYAAIHAMFADSLTWNDVRWLTTITDLPVIAKGILTGHDASQAIAAGCSAVYVSNHGGRQLDSVFSSIRALPEVVKAVDGRVEVYMDGGIRKGTDVLKALALGARAVFAGRPILYGLAVEGEKGATSVLTILRNELKLAMQLSGVTDIERIPEDLVVDKSMIAKL